MKLAIVAGGNPLNINTWSGTPFHMTKRLLIKYPDATIVTHPSPRYLPFIRKVIRRLTFGRIDIYWSIVLARLNARSIERSLVRHQVDLVFCIGNSAISAFLGKKFITIHVSDATVPLMENYYQEFSRLPGFLLANARRLDCASVLAARACLYSTAWAAQSASRDYKVSDSRLHVIPWGANIRVNEALPARAWVRSDTCHLVFIGVDWQRKGGDIAVSTARLLAAQGMNVKLHIVGSCPNLETNESIVVHGFLDKNTQEGLIRLERIMAQACFLFVPTRQDCSPMVFAEANAFGIPVITTRTGGVPDVVIEGVNGRLLPLDAIADDYAELIRTTWSDESTYAHLRTLSARRFQDVLNWDRWLTKAAEIIDQVGAEPKTEGGPPGA